MISVGIQKAHRPFGNVRFRHQNGSSLPPHSRPAPTLVHAKDKKSPVDDGFEPSSQAEAGNKSMEDIVNERLSGSSQLGQLSQVMDQASQEDDAGAVFRQLFGMKGAKKEESKWKVRLQLMKPVTWPPLILVIMAGAAASGNFTWTLENVLKSMSCMVLSGPLLTGYTQVMNDYFDREIDAINEPYRPIPSGIISEKEAITQFVTLLALGLTLSFGLDLWAGHSSPNVFYVAVFGSVISYIYSAPPLKLKQNGWAGAYALGSSYIALPWWCGQAMFGSLTLDVMALTLVYSIAGIGIAIVNDFKSIEGDKQLGLDSIPVMFGIDGAKWLSVACIDVTQLGVVSYLYFFLDKPIYAYGVLACFLPQLFFQIRYLIPNPLENDVKYQGFAQPFLVLGLVITAMAWGTQHIS